MRHEKLFPLILTASLSAIMLTACESTPEPVEVVQIEPPVLKTCTEISALTRVVIPEETKTFWAITEIENPGYEPIQRKEKQVLVIKEAQTVFVDSNGRQVTDICDTVIDPGANDTPGQVTAESYGS